MVIIIALLSLLSVYLTDRLDTELRHGMAFRARVQALDGLLNEFIEARGRLTQFVIEEETDVSPLVGQVRALQTKAETMLEGFPEGEDRGLVEEFVGQIRQYRAAMAAYAYELSLRRTGDGARSWEKNLMDIERKAHDLSLELKNRFRQSMTKRDQALAELARQGRFFSLAFGAMGLLSALLVALLLQRALKKPVQDLVRVAEAVAGGDLAQNVQGDARDELGTLASAIAAMMGSLQRIVRQIQKTTGEMEGSAAQLSRLATEVSGGASRQEQEIFSANASVAQLDAIVHQISDQVQRLTDSLNRSSSSTEQITAAIRETSSLSDSLAVEVEQITSALVEMNANVQEIVIFLDYLSDASREMSSSAEEMAESSGLVGSNGREATRLAREVKEVAEARGLDLLAEMEKVTAKNKELVEDYRDFIAGLDKKSSEIGRIVHVIGGIAEQTNLLSLNASIIAAQAGEHGRGFAVVADEVRNLSFATSNNLREISEAIGGVQNEVEQAVHKVERLLDGADSSLAATKSVGAVLKDIVTYSNRSLEMAGSIEVAAQEQMHRSQEMKRKATTNAEQVYKAKDMIGEQKKGAGMILMSSENLRDVVLALKRNTREQAEGSAVISRSMIELHHFSQEIGEAMGSEQALSRALVDSLEQISQVAKANMAATETLERGVESLRDLSARLQPEVRHFRLAEGVEEPG